MARSIDDIKNSMIAAVQADPVLSPLLTSTSAVSIWRVIIFIVAAAQWTSENLMDIFKSDVDATIAAKNPPTLQWYAETIKNFQYGYNLVTDETYYDNTGLTDEAVAASKIVTYCSVVELEKGIRIKVAKTAGADLGPLSDDEMTSLIAYAKRVLPAGVHREITTGPADNLKLVLRIFYNPLVLSSTGARIDGITATPVPDAIRAFLKNLPFNGVYSTQKQVDAIQAVDGVDDLAPDQVQTKYGALPYKSVDVSTVPDAGYLRIDDADLTITYTPNE